MDANKMPKHQLKRVDGKPYWFRTIGGVLCVEIRPLQGNVAGAWETYSFDRARMLETLSWEDWDSVKALCYCRGCPNSFKGNEGTIG